MNIESTLKCLLAVVIVGGSVIAQENLVLPPVFMASFEEDEGYVEGKSLLNQKEWSISSADRNNAEVKREGSSSQTQPPMGNYLARVTTGNVHLHRILSEVPLRERVVFKGFAAVDPSGVRPATARFFLSGAPPDQRFKGASFGISEEDDKLVITYRDNEQHLVLSKESPISAGVFYRFECNANLEHGTYNLKVYEHGNDELVGEVSEVKLRGGLKRINFLMLQGSTGACFDGISVSGN